MSDENKKTDDVAGNVLCLDGNLSPDGHPIIRVDPNPNRQAIKEEDGVHLEWYKQAEKVRTPEELAAFAKRLMFDYSHDYGTICHAVAATAIAGAHCIDSDPYQGGITGFQAGCIMWEFVTHWMADCKGPMKLMKFENMLYPQYQDKFEKVITKSTWEHLQKTAKENIEKAGEDGAHEEVLAHWKSIVEGKVPFGYTIAEG